eukprot:COSAG06_NODE_5479_length_3453_cov_2.172033_2_plen_123_part_00
MEPIRSTSNNCLAHCVALAGPHGANLPPRDGYQIDSDSHVVRYISSRRRRGNAFTNYKKLQEFSKARQRLPVTQAAAPSDDCELARTHAAAQVAITIRVRAAEGVPSEGAPHMRTTQLVAHN